VHGLTEPQSIAGHCRVHPEAPEIDSAGHAPAIPDALSLQPIHYRHAANAVVTDDDNRRFGVLQLVQMVGNRAHWNQPRTLDTANIVLRGLPDVDQPQRKAPVQEFLDFERGYFEREVVYSRGVAHIVKF
jgi:hypothetical protein